MKLLLALILALPSCGQILSPILLAPAPPAAGGPALTCLPNAATGIAANTTTATATYGANNAGGNLLIGSTSIDNITTDVYSDSTSSTWASAQVSANPSDQSTNIRATLGFSLSAIGGANTVTSTFGALSFAALSVMECHRTSGTWSEDQGNKGSGTFSTPDPGSITPTTQPEVIVVHINLYNTATVLTTPSGWTLANNNGNQEYLYYMVVTSTAAVHFVSPTSVVQWSAQVDSFK